jgi:hypothetical protein
MSYVPVTELEDDRQAIRQLCRRLMRARKSNANQKLHAAQLLAGISGWYGPGRPKSSAFAELSSHESPQLNNHRKENMLSARERIERAIRGESPN